MSQLEFPNSFSLADPEPIPALEHSVPVTRTIGGAVALAGFTVLIGWTLQIGVLKSIFPGYPSMKPLTAAGFLLLGASLYLTPHTPSPSRTDWGSLLRKVGTFVVLGWALLTLIEYIFRLNLGIDTVLFSRSTLAEGSHYPGRMSFITALNFVVLSGALLFVDVKFWRNFRPTEILSLIALLGGLIPLFGYLFGASLLYGSSTPVSVSIHTSILFIALSFGALFTRVHGGVISVIVNGQAGGLMARKFLPPAVLLTILSAWLSYQGQLAGLYGTQIGPALFLSLNIAIMVCLVWITAVQLNRDGIRRQSAESDRSLLLIERAQHVSDDRFKNLFELSIDSMGIADLNGYFRLINNSFMNLLGYTRKEFLSRPFMDFIHPDDIDKTTHAYEDQLKRGEPLLFFKNRYLRKDGTAVSLEWTAKSDIPTATVFAIARDVTERDRLEADGKKHLALLNLAHDAIVVTDLERRITFWNEGAEETYGWRSGLALGRVTHELLRTTFPVPRETIEASLMEHGTWEGELTHFTREGLAIIVASRWSLLRDDNGSHDSVLEINRDITARKAAEKQVQVYSAELVRSNRELQDFAAIASHDLQEPLRKILTFAKELDEYSEVLGEHGRDRLSRMQGAADRMKRLINDLLALSRVTSKSQPFTRTDLANAAREAVSNLEARIQETGGQVEIGELHAIDADPVQMQQLLQNLIGNGLKFHLPGVPPVVKVRGEILQLASPGANCPMASEVYRLTVEDNGIGFNEKYLDRIFTVFQRLHGRQQYEGTGIGLAICRKVAERHGGDITARSVPGQGATFIVTLPIVSKHEELKR